MIATVRTFLALVVFSGVAGVAVFVEGRGVPAPDAPLAEHHAFWVHEIRTKGGQAAYERLARFVNGGSYGAQHEEAHIFGAALYEVEGEKGVGVCDARFSYGCFHEFLARAIEDGGSTSIPRLNDACFDALTESPLSCQHGIGHGAIAVAGYEPDDLTDALSLCDGLRGADTIGGCYGGVFMEYNLRTMWGEEAEPRAPRVSHYEPCDTLPGRYLPACLYWQSQWWGAVLAPGDVGKTYRRMGELCREFTTDTTLLRQCFEGIGNTVAQASAFGPMRARELCDTSGETDAQRLLCRSVGANHLGVDVGVAAGLLVCEGLSGEYHAFCAAYARNEAHVFNGRPFPPSP